MSCLIYFSDLRIFQLLLVPPKVDSADSILTVKIIFAKEDKKMNTVIYKCSCFGNAKISNFQDKNINRAQEIQNYLCMIMKHWFSF